MRWRNLSASWWQGRLKARIWAEAVARYRSGEQWYMTTDLETLARKEQALRLEPDDWEESVLSYVEGKTQVTTKAIMVEQFGWDNPALWTQAHTKRLGAILHANNWKSAPYREGGTLVKGYVKIPVTGNTGNIDATGNSVSDSKNNGVTGVTGVTGPIYVCAKESLSSISSITTKTTVSGPLPEKTGNTGNTGRSIYRSL